MTPQPPGARPPIASKPKPTLRLAVSAIVLPALWIAAVAAVVVPMIGDLPDPIARHWGAGGRADGFSSTEFPLWMLASIGVLAVLFGVVVTVTATSSTIARTWASLNSGLAAFLSVILLITVMIQRGVTDAATVPFPAWSLPIALLAGLGAGLAAAALIPVWGDAAADIPIDTPRDLAIGPRERIAWSSSATSPLIVALIGGLAVASTALGAVLLGAWWMLMLSALVLVLVIALMSIRVTVDRTGLRVRGALGLPRMSIPIERIASVGTVRVRALRDYGGFGYRVGARGPLRGSRGFILRNGEAIAVTTIDGRVEVTVVDDAATGAAVLEAVRVRRTSETT